MKTRYLTIILLGSFFVSGSLSANVEQAKQYLALKNYSLAIQEAKQSIEADKKNKAAYDILLKIYSDQKQDAEYVQVYKDYVENIENYSLSTLQDASAKSFRLKEYLLSNVFLQYARTINPQDPELLNLMGVNFFYLKQYKQSVASLRFAVKYSSNLDYLSNLARSYAFNGQTDLAIENYEKALTMNPRFTRASIELKALQSTGLASSIPVQTVGAKKIAQPIKKTQAPIPPIRKPAPAPTPKPAPSVPAPTPKPVPSVPAPTPADSDAVTIDTEDQ